ncbi:hypothetical protein [Promicromonospora sp. NPDC060271]|uniref:hypothetical protein n=1 Tax=Promicromonospora sp. NPDC060271 TaxID=3347089 RepID=UPI00365F3474
MDSNENGDPGAQGQGVPGRGVPSQEEALELPAAAGPQAPGDELAARRARRRTRLIGAAAALALVTVGGGGYLAGAAGSGGGGESTAEAPIVLDAPVSAVGSRAAESASGPMAAADTARTAGTAGMAAESADQKLSYPYGFWGRTVFHAGTGLSTSGAEAGAFGLDPAGVLSAETARRVGDALGASGKPREEGGSWVVGPTDGSGPTVHVYADGSGGFDFYDPARDPWSCPAPDKAESGTTDEAEPATTDEGGTDGAEILPAPDVPDCPTVTPDAAPAKDDAVAALRDVMDGLGVDSAGFELEAGDSHEDDPWRYVTAWQVVEGQRTGLSWSASVSASGIANLYGFLAETVSLGQYPVVSEAEAVERLGDPRFGASGGMIAQTADARTTLESDTASSDMMPAPDPTVPPAPTPGARIAWPVTDVTITSARLGLAQQSTPDGAVLMLPAYELKDADGNVWPVLAVAEDVLDFTP